MSCSVMSVPISYTIDRSIVENIVFSRNEFCHVVTNTLCYIQMATLLAKELAKTMAKNMAIQMLDKLVPVITDKMKEIIAQNREKVCDPAQTDALIDAKAEELKATLVEKINSVGGQRTTRRHRTRGTRRRAR